MKTKSEAELMADGTFSETIRLNPGAAASVHEDGLVILHVPSGRIFTSNRTGARIWQCLEERLPLQGIAAEIARDFGIDRATALEDAARFLVELERNELTERVGEKCDA
jgi:hypothetical protein